MSPKSLEDCEKSDLVFLLRKIKKEVDNVEGTARDTVCEIKEMLEKYVVGDDLRPEYDLKTLKPERQTNFQKRH